jgi:hypothetical protein
MPLEIRGLVADLRMCIDIWSDNSKRAKDILLEIAKQLVERKVCDKDKISITIKHMLREKIDEAKITERWIEECLPEDYKRKYAKSEESSLLEGKEILQRDGTVIVQRPVTEGKDAKARVDKGHAFLNDERPELPMDDELILEVKYLTGVLNQQEKGAKEFYLKHDGRRVIAVESDLQRSIKGV